MYNMEGPEGPRDWADKMNVDTSAYFYNPMITVDLFHMIKIELICASASFKPSGALVLARVLDIAQRQGQRAAILDLQPRAETEGDRDAIRRFYRRFGFKRCRVEDFEAERPETEKEYSYFVLEGEPGPTPLLSLERAQTRLRIVMG